MQQAPIDFVTPADSVLASAGAVGIGHGPMARELPVPYLSQTVTNWCWATCATMLSRYCKSSSLKICEAASLLIGNTCCKGAPQEGTFDPTWTYGSCNRTCSVAEVVELHGKIGLSSTHQGSAVSFDTLKNEIIANRAIEVAYSWTGGGGHVAIAYGFNSTTSSVNVNDPWPDTGQIVVPFDQLASAYGKGSWFDTWTGISTAGGTV